MKNLCFAIVAILCTIPVFSQTNILPTPSSVNKLGGSFVLNSRLTFQDGEFSKEQIAILKRHFITNEIVIQETEMNPNITFSHRLHLSPEAYGIEVSEDGVKISYGSSAGKFYGMISLLQLVEISTSSRRFFPTLKLEDAPEFEWRGLHLDVSRHFYTVDEVKNFIEMMAMYKFNTFHWHLTDDQGWRIEIKKYPELTEVGGFRDSTVIGHYTDTPRKYNHERYGGFYTQEEIKEVVAFAKEMHVTVVPEIEMPGHSRAALAAYPELSCTGEHQGVPGLWGIFDDIYCSKEESIVFLQDVLEEVLELFPSEYIHIGGDEAPKTRWEACPNCQKVIEENGLHDSHELQSYFIKRMDQFLTERGRKLIGWDEILEGGLSPNAAVMSWRGETGGIEAAKQGHNVVMSPTTYCYFDYYQSSHESEPLAIGGFLPLEKVYEFNPIPESLTKKEAKYILGGQANVWTEYIPDYDQVEYMVYPRALALMQSLWCQKKPEYSEFLDVFTAFHEKYLFVRSVDYSKSLHIPKLKIERTKNGVAYSWSGLDSTEVFSLYDRSNGGVENEIIIDNGELVEFTRGGNAMHDLELHYRKDLKIQHRLYTSDVLGAEIEMTPQPHKKYNHNGSLNLVDGILGTERWKGDQWLGFNSEKIEFIIDLDTLQMVDDMSIGFLNQNGSWIYLPDSMRVSVSGRNLLWGPVFDVPIKSDEIVVRENLELNKICRYIKIEIFPMEKIPEGRGGAGNTPWTFVDEIQIFSE